jgi:type IV secretion system protein TrbG
MTAFCRSANATFSKSANATSRKTAKPAFCKAATSDFRKSGFAPILLVGFALTGCASTAPSFSYDADVPPLPAVAAPATDAPPKPPHLPPGWTPAKGGTAAGSPTGRIENANAAARVEPRREGYFNAIQIYPWSEGALYQVYAAPGQITNIALEPGESLTGAGPIAAGDTARWIIGDTESGSGVSRRVHVLVKPTRPDITTNLVITTDRRIYMLELRSGEKPYMPAVAWAYPQPPAAQKQGNRFRLTADFER